MALSKEEKKAQKAAKLLAKLAAECEARKKVKKEELQREIKAQALTKGQLDKTWREILLKIKEPAFKQDTEVLWHSFDRALDKKDHIIKQTMGLMSTADDQFQRTIASFCVTIDSMINTFLNDLEELSKNNDIRTKRLLESGEIDAAQIITDHNAAEIHLQLMIFHGEHSADKLAWTKRGENLVKQDEDRNNYAYDREQLRSFLEDRYNLVWDEYKSVLKAYVVDTADTQKQVRRLRYKENLMADIIASQGKKIANSSGILKKLRTELAAYESGTKQAVFRDRRNRHRAACHKLKKRLTAGCAKDAKQLTLLVQATDGAMDWLSSAVNKGERILRLATLCRKFESQREKVLPFGSTIPQCVSQIKKKAYMEDSLIMRAISSTSGITRLWQRVARAELSKRALIREKILLEQENKYMINTIEQNKEKDARPDAQKCSCDELKKKRAINPPVAIEGVIEMSKYR